MNTNKAYRKGLWMIRILPILIAVAVGGLLVYMAFTDQIKHAYALYGICATIILSVLLSLRNVGAWKLWMVEHADRPKVVLERARDGFLSWSFMETLSLLSPAKRREFEGRLAQRISEYRTQHLEAARKHLHPDGAVTIRKKSSLVVALLVIILVVVSIALLMLLEERDPATISILVLILLACAGSAYFLIRSLFRKMKVVVVINSKGIRIHDAFYPWSSIDFIDVVKGDTLQLKTAHEEQSIDCGVLDIGAEALDEAIIYYRALGSENDGQSS